MPIYDMLHIPKVDLKPQNNPKIKPETDASLSLGQKLKNKAREIAFNTTFQGKF